MITITKKILSISMAVTVFALCQPVYSMHHTPVVQQSVLKQTHEESCASVAVRVNDIINLNVIPPLSNLRAYINETKNKSHVPFFAAIEEIHEKTCLLLKKYFKSDDVELSKALHTSALHKKELLNIKKIITDLRSVLGNVNKVVAWFVDGKVLCEIRNDLEYLLYACKVYLRGLKEQKKKENENFVDESDFAIDSSASIASGGRPVGMPIYVKMIKAPAIAKVQVK